MTIGTRANRPGIPGIWYNLGLLPPSPERFYPNLYGIQVSLDERGWPSQPGMTTADHWSTAFNCVGGLRNSVARHRPCTFPTPPKGLKASILRKYGSKTRTMSRPPYDYIVYYGTSLTPAKSLPDFPLLDLLDTTS